MKSDERGFMGPDAWGHWRRIFMQLTSGCTQPGEWRRVEDRDDWQEIVIHVMKRSSRVEGVTVSARLEHICKQFD